MKRSKKDLNLFETPAQVAPPVFDSPEKLIVELEAEIIDARRAIISLANACTRYQYLTRKIFSFYTDSDVEWKDIQPDIEAVEGLNAATDSFSEYLEEIGFVVNPNGFLILAQAAQDQADETDETYTLQDPHIIGG